MKTTVDPQVRRIFKKILADLDGDQARLRALTDALDRRLRSTPLERLCRLWDLSQAEAARIFGISRQALGQWITGGPPADRSEAIADLAVATDLLDLHLARERISAVVRRPAQALGGRSLLDLARNGSHREVRQAVETMFDLRRVQP